MWTKIAIPTAWWIKITIPTIIYLYNYIMCAEIAIHTLGVVLITVDLFLMFRIICYTLALMGVPIEKDRGRGA